jgi:hypothetical protein
VEVAELVQKKADRLFLKLDKEFSLAFCEATSSYHLKNPKVPSCHPLELFLISDRRFTGNKIKDLLSTTNRGHRWLLGFYHSCCGKQSKYRNSEYLDGYAAGSKINMK